MKKALAVLLLGILGLGCGAESLKTSDFSYLDSCIDSLLKARTSVNGKVKIRRAALNHGKLDFDLSESLSNFPLRSEDIVALKSELEKQLKGDYSGYSIGSITSSREGLGKLEVADAGSSGSPAKGIKGTESKVKALVDRGIKASDGLSGRHIALWQSHGYYFNNTDTCWMWQRPVMFQTVEDLFTQSFVVPFLVPMLENAGANVLLPRERDWHRQEIIIDNDVCERGSGRIHGTVEIPSRGWKKCSSGFCDAQPRYTGRENPFYMGTFLSSKAAGSKATSSSIHWKASIPERGEYAVYVTYASLPDACNSANYTVHALGGDITLKVNQSMGGGSWVYLGTFEFDCGEQRLVSLTNMSSDSGTITADAVKIGGGMGNIARPSKDSTGLAVSGKPRFAEGARYFLQWSGYPDKVWNVSEGIHDYQDDFKSRGLWVQTLTGGSPMNPKSNGLSVPVDLSLAFHTDAGTFPGDSIVGTLAIYTLKSEGSDRFPNGGSRRANRELTDFVQSQVVSDLRAQWDSLWTRRQIWNRAYFEARTPGVPAVLMELLSHQNFEDMKYGLDPVFRFTVGRAYYKGILKFIAMRYAHSYTVQPLPVRSFSASPVIGKGKDACKAELRWRQTPDSLEPTAVPTSYIVYTRIDGKGWDKGNRIAASKKSDWQMLRLPVERGHIYSFKVVAANDGGLSFPSEILSIGIPDITDKGNVLIINNFHRVSGPVWFDSPTYAGFDNGIDSGVPYVRDWCFTGAQNVFDRNRQFVNDADCGFGASGQDYADRVIAGNSFDYPFIHGRSLFKAGYSFGSCSSEAFETDAGLYAGSCAVDLICGKECEVLSANRSRRRGGILPPSLQNALSNCAMAGCGIIISGCYIGHDIFGAVYPGIDLRTDSLRMKARKFAGSTLGYSLRVAYGSRSGEIRSERDSSLTASFPMKPCEESYCVESPDALSPSSGSTGETYLIYSDTGLPAGLFNDLGTHRTAAFGFPLEILDAESTRDRIFLETMDFLTGKTGHTPRDGASVQAR